MAVLGLAACSPKQGAAPPPAAPQPAPTQAPPLPAASAPAPESPPAGAVTPEKAAAPAPAPAPAAAPAAAASYHWSPADYAKRERRLAALIANAETRDGSGETQRRAEEGRYRRSRCTTRACIEQSYASEEAWLRQWEGSGDAK